MKTELLKNRLGVRLAKGWGRRLSGRNVDIGGFVTTMNVYGEIVHAHSVYTKSQDFSALQRSISNLSTGFSEVLTFEDALWNLGIDSSLQDHFIKIISKHLGIKFESEIDFQKKKVELVKSLDEKYKNLFFTVFYKNPEIATLLIKSGYIDKIQIPTGLDNEFQRWEENKYDIHLNDLMAVRTFEDFKNWQDSCIINAKCKYLDATNSDCFDLISSFDTKNEFIRKALKIDSCKTFVTRELSTSLWAPQADCYFLSITNSQSQYETKIPNVFSTAVFIASCEIDLAEKFIRASFISTTNIIFCLTYSTYNRSPNIEKGWWNPNSNIDLKISIGEKNVFFVTVDDSNPLAVVKSFDQRVSALGFNLEKIGSVNFVRKNEFKIYETPNMHESLMSQLIGKLVDLR